MMNGETSGDYIIEFAPSDAPVWADVPPEMRALLDEMRANAYERTGVTALMNASRLPAREGEQNMSRCLVWQCRCGLKRATAGIEPEMPCRCGIAICTWSLAGDKIGISAKQFNNELRASGHLACEWDSSEVRVRGQVPVKDASKIDWEASEARMRPVPVKEPNYKLLDPPPSFAAEMKRLYAKKEAPPPSPTVRAWGCRDCERQVVVSAGSRAETIARDDFCRGCGGLAIIEVDPASLDLMPRAEVERIRKVAEGAICRASAPIKVESVSCNHNLGDYVHRDELTEAVLRAERLQIDADLNRQWRAEHADALGDKDHMILQLRAEVGRLTLEARRGGR